MNALSLVGAWSLESCELVGSGGATSYPVGKKPVGYIIYGQDGYMSVAFMSSDRQPFAADDILGGSPEEKIAAVDTRFFSCNG